MSEPREIGPSDDPDWVSVRAILIDSSRLESEPYGRVFEFNRETLEDVAASMNAGAVLSHVEHDHARTLRVRNQRAWVETTDAGLHRVVATYQVHAEDWAKASHLTGMSTTMTSQLASFDGGPGRILLAGDGAWFADSDLVEAGKRLAGPTSVDLRVMFQFSVIPDPQIVLDVSRDLLGLFASGVATNALWDSIKYLISRRRTPQGGNDAKRTRVNIHAEDGPRRVTALVDTEGEELGLRAVETVGAAIEKVFRSGSPGPLMWNHETETWDELPY